MEREMKYGKLIRAASIALVAASMTGGVHAGFLSSCTKSLANSSKPVDWEKKAWCVIKEGISNPNFLATLVASDACATIYGNYKAKIKGAKATVRANKANIRAATGAPATPVDFSFLDGINTQELHKLVACFGGKKVKKILDLKTKMETNQKSFKTKGVSVEYGKAYLKQLIDRGDTTVDQVASEESAQPNAAGGGESPSDMPISEESQVEAEAPVE